MGRQEFAILLNELVGIDRAVTVLVVNILMIILAAIFLDRGTTVRITFGGLLLLGNIIENNLAIKF